MTISSSRSFEYVCLILQYWRYLGERASGIINRETDSKVSAVALAKFIAATHRGVIFCQVVKLGHGQLTDSGR